MKNQLAFLRLVEVFPPFLGPKAEGHHTGIEERIANFVSEVKAIRDHADVILVATLKNPLVTTLSSVEAAAILRDKLGVEAAPVVVARDSNSMLAAALILGSYAADLRTLMLAWGDRTPGRHPKNVYDFPNLSAMIGMAKKVASEAGVAPRLLAPVDLSRLGDNRGRSLAISRLKAGAQLLLAQPPTTDSRGTFDSHLSLIESSGLRDKVLLGVFPFRDRADVVHSQRYFGWNLPPRLLKIAESGRSGLLDEARAVARRLREEGLPGVYLSTRGTPSIAKKILG